MTFHAKDLSDDNVSYRIEPIDDCFSVYTNETDLHVGGPYVTRAMAEGVIKNLLAKNARRSDLVTRPCMTCQKDFESAGIHNRMCELCRRKTEGMI